MVVKKKNDKNYLIKKWVRTRAYEAGGTEEVSITVHDLVDVLISKGVISQNDLE